MSAQVLIYAARQGRLPVHLRLAQGEGDHDSSETKLPESAALKATTGDKLISPAFDQPIAEGLVPSSAQGDTVVYVCSHAGAWPQRGVGSEAKRSCS